MGPPLEVNGTTAEAISWTLGFPASEKCLVSMETELCTSRDNVAWKMDIRMVISVVQRVGQPPQRFSLFLRLLGPLCNPGVKEGKIQ